MLKNIYKAATLHLLAMILILTGCVSDNEPGGKEEFKEGKPVEVAFSISSRFNGSGMSRTDGTPADPENDSEKIKDWFIVFIDKNGVVAKIVSRSEAEIVGEKPAAVEKEIFRCILPAGKYTVYAFANITQAQLKTATGLEFSVGKQLGSTFKSTIGSGTWTSELNGWNISNAIPMTGHRENVEINSTIEEALSIEVVRMLAKVQFHFSNPTATDIKVRSISLDPVTASKISLFPNGGTASGIDYTYLGERAYTPLGGATYSKFTIDCTPNVEVKANTQQTSPKEHAIYIKESLSDRENDGAFTVGLKVVHGNGGDEYQQYNITSDIRSYINRNDWIEIPIELTQYDVSVEALFYPPIGGYPAVLSTTAPDGSQVFTFGTQGEFSLVPHVFDKETGLHLEANKYSIKDVKVVSDVNGIFTKSPAITHTSTSLPDEITGTLSANRGKAKVEVTVEIKTGNQIYRSYVRNIYIKRS